MSPKLKILLKKILFIFSICLLTVALFVAANVFIYEEYYIPKDTLIKIVPKDALFYGHLTYRQHLLGSVLSQNIFEDKFKAVYEEIDKFLEPAKLKLKKDIMPIIDKEISLAALRPSSKSKIEIVFIFKIKNQKKFEEILDKLKSPAHLTTSYYKDIKITNIPTQFSLKGNSQNIELNYAFLSKKIVAISESKEAIEYIITTYVEEAPSLAQNFTLIKVSEVFDKSYLLKIYLAPEKIITYLKEKSPSPFTNLIISEFSDDKHSAIYFGLKSQKNYLAFKIRGTSDTEESEEQENLINIVPSSTLFVAQNINFKKILKDFEDSFQEAESLSATSVNKIKNIYERFYGFKTENILSLLGEQNEIVIIPKEKNQYDYILATKPSTPEIQERLEKLEEIFKGILARFFPTEKKKVLPDGTTITEIIADPELFQFKTLEIKDPETKIHYTSVPQINLSFAYTLWQNKIIMSNSPEALQKILKIQKDIPQKEILDINNLKKSCSSLKGETFFIDPKILTENNILRGSFANCFSSIQKILLISEKTNGIITEGCVY
ncbi:MAG: hypothetical protein COX43_02150 [Parcubacteria group bacterium CG23_combo_of_CG06-09_8_20_14_all_35_9]|nr:MAG: hypothetical protein COX43_02150 [Parcubacteria group bacterium CG23_combo_of_CG06-09_8_20_14_all_35_9]